MSLALLNSALMEAARIGDMASAIALLAQGADIGGGGESKLDGSEYIPLVGAARHGHLLLTAFLLDRGADIHAAGDDALREAAMNGELDVVALLLDRGADLHAQQDHALRLAAVRGHAPTVAHLCDRGARPHAKNYEALRYAAWFGHTDIVAYLIERLNGRGVLSDDSFALRHACSEGHVDVVALLLPYYNDTSTTLATLRDEATTYGHGGIAAIIDSYRQMRQLARVNCGAATVPATGLRSTDIATPIIPSQGPALCRRL